MLKRKLFFTIIQQSLLPLQQVTQSDGFLAKKLGQLIILKSLRYRATLLAPCVERLAPFPNHRDLQEDQRLFWLGLASVPPCERLFLSVERDAKEEGRVKAGEEAATMSTSSTGYQRPHP